MSLSGGDMSDMGDRLSDADIESLMTGSNEVDASLGELIADMRDYADWRPDPTQQTNHIVGAMAAVQVTAEGAAGGVKDLSSPATTRRQGMIGRIMASRVAKVLAATLATLLATSGIAWAATGSNPVDQVTSVVEQVGQVFNNDVDDDQANETDVDDIDDDHATVVDDTKDDDVEETEVEDSDDDHAAVVDDETSDDDHVKESDHEEVDEHEADHTSDHESETDD